jgi:hypothetical protein
MGPLNRFGPAQGFHNDGIWCITIVKYISLGTVRKQEEHKMSEEKMTIEEFHKRIAVLTNNSIWPILDKAEPTKDEIEEALHMAHTSLYHWSKVGQPINIARAEYMISRVYSAFSWAEPALYHAQRCLRITEETGVGDFDLAFAYEAMTRAYTVAGKKAECKKYRALTQKATNVVKNEEDRKICQAELDKIKCN